MAGSKRQFFYPMARTTLGLKGDAYECNIAVDDIVMWTANPYDLLLDGKKKLDSLTGSPDFKVELPVGESEIFHFTPFTPKIPYEKVFI